MTGVAGGRGYSSGGGELSLRGGKRTETTRETIERIKTSRGVAGDDKREDEDSGSGYLKIIQ